MVFEQITEDYDIPEINIKKEEFWSIPETSEEWTDLSFDFIKDIPIKDWTLTITKKELPDNITFEALIRWIVENLEDTEQIKNLNLDWLWLTSDSNDFVWEEFKNFGKLKNINLANNLLTWEIFSELPPKLKRINLENNDIKILQEDFTKFLSWNPLLKINSEDDFETIFLIEKNIIKWYFIYPNTIIYNNKEITISIPIDDYTTYDGLRYMRYSDWYEDMSNRINMENY